jgi:hypothetical protein
LQAGRTFFLLYYSNQGKYLYLHINMLLNALPGVEPGRGQDSRIVCSILPAGGVLKSYPSMQGSVQTRCQEWQLSNAIVRSKVQMRLL